MAETKAGNGNGNGEAKNRRRLAGLYTQLTELHAKQAEVLEEIGHALAGEPGAGELLERARLTWSELWKARYRGDYMWQHTRDMPQLKRMIRALGIEEVEARMAVYIKSGESFYKEARHGFQVFISQINRFATHKEGGPDTEFFFGLDVDAPIDCKHEPKCKTDQEHTSRRQRELRS